MLCPHAEFRGQDIMFAHQAEFHDRIARIRAGQGSTKSTVFVGQDLSFTYVPPNRRKPGGLGQVVANAGYALSFPFCAAIGLLSHGLERYLTFQLAGLPDPRTSVDLEMVRMAMAGFLLAVVLSHIVGLRDRGLLLPKLLGVAFGMLFFHNFVHLWPHVFEAIFSPIWVAKITAMTEPHSLYWRGISFPF
jgi:hypothetical protein